MHSINLSRKLHPGGYTVKCSCGWTQDTNEGKVGATKDGNGHKKAITALLKVGKVFAVNNIAIDCVGVLAKKLTLPQLFDAMNAYANHALEEAILRNAYMDKKRAAAQSA